LLIAGITTAGVGALSLGGGMILGLSSQSQEKKAKEDCVDEFCPTDTESDIDSARSMASTANILFIAGGVLAATGITLVVLSTTKKSGPESARLKLIPSVAPSGGGLLATGSF
jgi:hypothetical protein